MNILKKPYEISIWDDVLEGDTIKEVKRMVIGSDTSTGQNRALEPVLVTNTNGTKKFSFKLYKRYKDIVTGEEVENPFVPELYNERKVKLKYDGKWYDFLVKEIEENSSNYLYSY
jgi:hypothetical protein